MGMMTNHNFGKLPLPEPQRSEVEATIRRQLDETRMAWTANKVGNKLGGSGGAPCNPFTGQPFPGVAIWANLPNGAITAAEKDSVKQAVPGGYAGAGGIIRASVSDEGGSCDERLITVETTPIYLRLGDYASYDVKVIAAVNEAAEFNMVWLWNMPSRSDLPLLRAPVWDHPTVGAPSGDHFTPKGAKRVRPDTTGATLTWKTYGGKGGGGVTLPLTSSYGLVADQPIDVQGGIFNVSDAVRLYFELEPF